MPKKSRSDILCLTLCRRRRFDRRPSCRSVAAGVEPEATTNATIFSFPCFLSCGSGRGRRGRTMYIYTLYAGVAHASLSRAAGIVRSSYRRRTGRLQPASVIGIHLGPWDGKTSREHAYGRTPNPDDENTKTCLSDSSPSLGVPSSRLLLSGPVGYMPAGPPMRLPFEMSLRKGPRPEQT